MFDNGVGINTSSRLFLKWDELSDLFDPKSEARGSPPRSANKLSGIIISRLPPSGFFVIGEGKTTYEPFPKKVLFATGLPGPNGSNGLAIMVSFCLFDVGGNGIPTIPGSIPKSGNGNASKESTRPDNGVSIGML